MVMLIDNIQFLRMTLENYEKTAEYSSLLGFSYKKRNCKNISLFKKDIEAIKETFEDPIKSYPTVSAGSR